MRALLAKIYVKTKELGPVVGGGRGGFANGIHLVLSVTPNIHNANNVHQKLCITYCYYI